MLEESCWIVIISMLQSNLSRALHLLLLPATGNLRAQGFQQLCPCEHSGFRG